MRHQLLPGNVSQLVEQAGERQRNRKASGTSLYFPKAAPVWSGMNRTPQNAAVCFFETVFRLALDSVRVRIELDKACSVFCVHRFRIQDDLLWPREWVKA